MAKVLKDITNIFDSDKTLYPSSFVCYKNICETPIGSSRFSQSNDYTQMLLSDLWKVSTRDSSLNSECREPIEKLSLFNSKASCISKLPSDEISKSCELQELEKKLSLNSIDSSTTNPKGAGKFKTELCKNFMESGYCNYGDKCRFAHGKEDLVFRPILNSKYKSKPCMSFHTLNYCPYGNRCLFKHDERAFQDLPRSYYSNLLKMPNLRSKARSKGRRLAVFQMLSDKEEFEMDEVFTQLSHSLNKILDSDDAAPSDKARTQNANPKTAESTAKNTGLNAGDKMERGGVYERKYGRAENKENQKPFKRNGKGRDRRNKHNFIISRYNVLHYQ